MSRTNVQFTDNEFIEGLRSGDNIVLSALYKKYYNIVLKFIVNNSGTEEAARDIYQEAVIVLYEKAQQPDFNLTCQLQTYIYSVVKRLWLKQLKNNGKTFLFKDDDENEVVDVTADFSEYQEKEKEIEKMNKSLMQLGEPCSSLIKDFYVLKLNMEELAEKYGYTNADNAKNQKYKCLQRLKRHFFEKSSIEQDLKL
ncbi:MAG: sigma-70 family RNA polymerase sigma factor [bacterium]|nr:sigma-70 family RNA polymerase sigma factor [bacterium]